MSRGNVAFDFDVLVDCPKMGRVSGLDFFVSNRNVCMSLEEFSQYFEYVYGDGAYEIEGADGDRIIWLHWDAVSMYRVREKEKELGLLGNVDRVKG